MLYVVKSLGFWLIKPCISVAFRFFLKVLAGTHNSIVVGVFVFLF